MGSDLGKCVKCESYCDVEEYDVGLLCASCIEDLKIEMKEQTEKE